MSEALSNVNDSTCFVMDVPTRRSMEMSRLTGDRMSGAR